MKKHRLTEHYLIPTVLFLLNICVVHVIYLFTAGHLHSEIYLIAVIIAFILLAGSLFTKRQAYLAGSAFFYLLLLLWI